MGVVGLGTLGQGAWEEPHLLLHWVLGRQTTALAAEPAKLDQSWGKTPQMLTWAYTMDERAFAKIQHS